MQVRTYLQSLASRWTTYIQISCIHIHSYAAIICVYVLHLLYVPSIELKNSLTSKIVANTVVPSTFQCVSAFHPHWKEIESSPVPSNENLAKGKGFGHHRYDPYMNVDSTGSTACAPKVLSLASKGLYNGSNEDAGCSIAHETCFLRRYSSLSCKKQSPQLHILSASDYTFLKYTR